MTTDEMLIEIVNYKYQSYGFPYVFLDYSQTFKTWSISWRNPIQFTNTDDRHGETPNDACKKAIDFIRANPDKFTHKPIK